MKFADAMTKAVKEHPDRLLALKRDKATAAAANRIEEHAYHRVSKTKRRKHGKRSSDH